MRAMPLRVLGCVVVLFAALALLAASAMAQQPRTAQSPVAMRPSPMTPGSTPTGIPAPPPVAVQPALGGGGTVMPATAGDIGICQCIADRSTRKLSCLSSAAECQSSCASTHFAFTPHAIYSCPMASDATSAAMSPAR